MDSHDARGGYLPDDAVEVGKDGESILGNYKGTVVADGYVVYENLSRARPFRLANCWAHVFRHAEDAHEKDASPLLWKKNGAPPLHWTVSDHAATSALPRTSSSCW